MSNLDLSEQPDYIPIGHSVRLVSLPELARVFRVSQQRALDLLASLAVPAMSVISARSDDGPTDGKIYVNLFGLETAIFAATMPTWYPDPKTRPGLAAWYQSMAALENASLDRDAMKARLQAWIRRLKVADRRKARTRAGASHTEKVPAP